MTPERRGRRRLESQTNKVTKSASLAAAEPGDVAEDSLEAVVLEPSISALARAGAGLA